MRIAFINIFYSNKNFLINLFETELFLFRLFKTENYIDKLLYLFSNMGYI